jgi:mRNA interferase HigB
VSSGNPVVVFNIRGNKYRLIVAIHYRPSGRVFVLRFLTHAEYDKEKWKAEL